MNKKVLFTYVISALALIGIIGVSLAYYTSSVSGSNSNSNVITARLGNVGYVITSPSTEESVLPGWEGSGSTSVYLTSSSDQAINYHCTIKLAEDSYQNNVYVKTVGEDGQAPTLVMLSTDEVELSRGTLDAETVSSGLTGTKHNVEYFVVFRETGTSQNEDQGKTIKTNVVCSVDEEGFSAYTILSGRVYDENNNLLTNQPMVAFSSPSYFVTDENGYYSVTLPQGDHEIYYIPSVTTVEELKTLSESVKTNENAKQTTIDTAVTSNISFVKHTVSVSCTGCTVDSSSKEVPDGQTATFTITPNENYSLEGATVTGGCSLTNNKLSLANVKENTNCSLAAEAEATRLVDQILIDNPTISTRTSFYDVFVDNTTGTIYSTDRTDDDSTVYYYAGNTTNNWVIFGNNGSGTYYYWRIIRTNSDEEGGGVRLLYSGSGTSSTSIPDNLTNAIAISNQKFNDINDNASYIGYMYTLNSQHGNTVSSNAKTQLESWYTSSGLSNFESKINKKAIYCNDRSVVSTTTWSATGKDLDYVIKKRYAEHYPTHKCGGKIYGDYYENATNRLADKFSAESNPGNGLLSKPIGLMTADEVVFAGGKDSNPLTSPYAWYYTNKNGNSITGSSDWWTMTPSSFFNNTAYVPRVCGKDAFGYLAGINVSTSIVNVSTSIGIRPVISLVSNTSVSSGNGTPETPYIIAN